MILEKFAFYYVDKGAYYLGLLQTDQRSIILWVFYDNIYDLVFCILLFNKKPNY